MLSPAHQLGQPGTSSATKSSLQALRPQSKQLPKVGDANSSPRLPARAPKEKPGTAPPGSGSASGSGSEKGSDAQGQKGKSDNSVWYEYGCVWARRSRDPPHAKDQACKVFNLNFYLDKVDVTKRSWSESSRIRRIENFQLPQVFAALLRIALRTYESPIHLTALQKFICSIVLEYFSRQCLEVCPDRRDQSVERRESIFILWSCRLPHWEMSLIIIEDTPSTPWCLLVLKPCSCSVNDNTRM